MLRRVRYFTAFSWVLSLWLAGWLVVSRVCRVSVRAINRSTVRRLVSQCAGYLLLLQKTSTLGKPDVNLYVLTVYPAESWAPRVRARECHGKLPAVRLSVRL